MGNNIEEAEKKYEKIGPKKLFFINTLYNILPR